MKITIVQRVLPEYRVALFEEIQRNLAKDKIDFLLLYGREMQGSTPASVTIEHFWAQQYKNLYLKLGKLTLILQLNIFIKLIRSDLIVVEQANSLLINYLLFLLKPLFNYKIAYWGHGYNHQSKNQDSFSEQIKLQLLKKTDWWFSYTLSTTHYLTARGVARSKITTLRNTIDTRQFATDLATISYKEILVFSKKYKLASGQTALYCGGLTKAKEIEFLLKSALIIRQTLPDFSLLLLGSGPEQTLVQDYARSNPGIIHLGSLYGEEKALAFKCADCILMPGLVGLVAIDSMVAEKPIVVRELKFHGPEMEYIKEYKTGLCVSSLAMTEYCRTVIELLTNSQKLAIIRDNCKQHKQTFNIEHMANSFCSGIKKCITLYQT
ncbi:MAG: glycosyltransferase family 4 protein [Pseudomonadota bacterium]